MLFRQGYYFLVPLDQVGSAILGITVQAAESAFTLLAASYTLPLGDILATVWANVFGPEFKKIALL